MTEFKYCVHCENEPAVCFNTEVDAMKFARECTDTCSCIKVEKSEIGEDGEILNNEVIWAADCGDVIEKEIVSGNEFDTEFPASDIENIDISDDADYDEIAKQYKEDPADWIDDSKLIREAVDALEENESEVECKCCFDIFPKESCVKTEKGYICKKCNQELHSHQGTNLDLIDSDPFSLDYEDPRDFDEPEEVEVEDKPVNANEVRKHEAGIEEKIEEHINDRPADIESDQEYQGVDNAVVDCKKYTVVAHSEDEKPVDCKLEKPALEEPLAGKKINNNLYEAKKDDELPVDPEAAKLEVHTMLNDLVADEIEAINGYDDAKAQIIDTPIEHKDNILDTIDHIKGEEQEHIDELIGATTEIPFEKEEHQELVAEESHDEPLTEALSEDKLQAMEKYLKSNKVAYLKTEWLDEGEHYTDEVSAWLDYSYKHYSHNNKVYNNKFVLTISRYHASEDNNAEYPERHTEEEEFSFDSLSDMYEDKECKEILDRIYENNLDELAKSLAEETHAKYAKPEGDRVAAYNNALKYAKKENKPFIYGYTNHAGKFFAAETPMKVTGRPIDAEKEFRSRYKNCNAVYVVYPDKDFIDEKLEQPINEELKVIIDFSDYKPWSGAVDTYELIKDADKLDELEAYFEELYPDGITATQINDILWFDGEEVLKYLGLGDAEDEEIDESLTEDVLTEFTPIAPHPVLYKEINKAYGNDGGFLITKRRKGKNESESAKKTNDITEAIKFVKELAKNKDIAEIHLQIVKTSKDILIYKDGKETFNKIVEVGKNLQAENKTKVGGDTISDIDELRDTTKKELEKLFADIANDYREAEQEKIKEILQNYAKQLRACTTKDEITLLDAVNKAKTDISKLKTKAEYEAEETANKDTSSEETADKESNDNASTDNTASTTKIKTDAAAAALKNAYPNNDKQIRIVLSMLKKANLTEDIDENLEEEKINIDYVVSLFGDSSHYYKEDNDIPLSPNISGATKFNKKKDISILDIVKDICEYSLKYMPEDEVASLFDLDTVEEVYEKDEDYFINSGLVEIISVFKLPESLEEAKEELPVDPEAAKLGVHTMLNDLVADEIEAINGYDDAKAEIMNTSIEHKDNILDTIDHIKGEEQEHIDELIDATTEIPFDKEEETPAPEIEEPFNQDFPEVDEDSEEKSLTETKAKPEGNKIKSYNDGLKLAKLHSKPVIYGYTNSSYGNKFFALDDPIVCDNVSDEAKKFRQQYKSCNVVYVAYPNDQFVED